MKHKIWLILVGAVLVVGIVLSYRDYRAWWHAEHDKFGQGNSVDIAFAPAGPLGLPYSSAAWNYRIKPPADWQVVDHKTSVEFLDPQTRAKIEVTGQKATTDLTTAANKLASGITEDRQYLSVDNVAMTVLTWDKSDPVTQKAVVITEGREIVISVTCAASAWKDLRQTFFAVYQSWIAI